MEEFRARGANDEATDVSSAAREAKGFGEVRRSPLIAGRFGRRLQERHAHLACDKAHVARDQRLAKARECSELFVLFLHASEVEVW